MTPRVPAVMSRISDRPSRVCVCARACVCALSTTLSYILSKCECLQAQSQNVENTLTQPDEVQYLKQVVQDVFVAPGTPQPSLNRVEYMTAGLDDILVQKKLVPRLAVRSGASGRQRLAAGVKESVFFRMHGAPGPRPGDRFARSRSSGTSSKEVCRRVKPAHTKVHRTSNHKLGTVLNAFVCS